MLYIAICDDEKYFCLEEQELITEFLLQRGYKVQFDQYASGEDLLRQGMKVAKYDVIFLDVNMDKLNGIETARQIRKYSNRNFIVFVTAFVQYAVSGYEVDAVRFILKDAITGMPGCNSPKDGGEERRIYIFFSGGTSGFAI